MTVFKQMADDLHALQKRDLASLEQVLERLNGTYDAIAPHVEEPGALPYGRKVVYADNDFEIVVVHIPPGIETAIHDHGDAAGCALVAKGMVINKEYRQNSCGVIELAREQFVPKEHMFRFDKQVIHSVQNPSHVGAVTVHVYTPPIAEIRVYEELPAFIASYI